MIVKKNHQPKPLQMYHRPVMHTESGDEEELRKKRM